MEVTLFLAAAAGLLSFISPCVLPLYPGVAAYITGISVSDLHSGKPLLSPRWILHMIFFLLGFSLIFMVIGFGSLSLSQFLFEWRNLLRVLGGALLIFFGSCLIGLLPWQRFRISGGLRFQSRPAGYFGSLLIGLAVSLGWTPCIGPILGSIITMAAVKPESAVWLMLAYVLGFCIPFILCMLIINKLQGLKKLGYRLYNISGFFILVVGILLILDWTTKITAYLSGIFSFYGL